MGELRFRPEQPDEGDDRPIRPDVPVDRPEPAPGKPLTWRDLELDDHEGKSHRPLAKPDSALPDDVPLVGPSDRSGEMPAAPDATERLPERGDERKLTSQVDRPAFAEVTAPVDRYGAPLDREGERRPVFDGPATREQTNQGDLGDCGVIATLGAVAGHSPDAIQDCVREIADGNYEVTLHEATYSGDNQRYEPTGRVITLTVTPDLPVYDDQPDRPAFANSGDSKAAWCSVMEKAVAGVEQTWTPERRDQWDDRWSRQARFERAAEAPPPDGYVRLDKGTTPWDRAELLTQVTGQPAEVRELPAGADALEAELTRRLDDGNPVLIGTRQLAEGEKRLPHRLVETHAYEVTKIEDGMVHMRNPWNFRHPEPLTIDQFRDYVQHYYTTLG